MVKAAGADLDLALPATSESILFKFLSSTRDAVLVVDAGMRIFAANEAAYGAFPRAGDGLEGRRLSEVVRDAVLHDAVRWSVERRETSDLRLTLSGQDARVFDVHIAPISIDGHELSIAFFSDVTQIERLERIRQEFLSNISHELRTPLTSIIAFVETLEDGAIDDIENNRRFLGVIKRNAERMRCLISDILELSLIESGRISVELQSVDLRSLTEVIFSDLSSKAQSRSVELLNKIPDGTRVSADPMRLEQMLTNLIDNAIKFDREGGRVTASFSNESKRDLISITDTGEGILPEHINRIFERFYRADRARTSDAGGTGLGLAIVKHLAKLQGGEVSAVSELGVGSTFTIELPHNAV